MIAQRISFVLPLPWTNKTFTAERIGSVNFLVGPNGSGKSRFAQSLQGLLPGSRLLGTDRLQGMSANLGLGIWGDNLAGGYQKNHFDYFKASAAHGSGIDSFIILEERPDIRVKVEATLSNLFNRKISIEWDSGNLIPKASSSITGSSYRLDREECHGIRELLVLLTHLYNNYYKYLIIDEPELNLHPQYQAFFMQEVRKMAGPPSDDDDKKVVFLITHSPFMIDIKSVDDLYSTWSFSSDHSEPVFLTSASDRIASLVSRLNVHHKQLFFSDNPIFVEGVLDTQIIEAIQQRRKFSITAAGSCIIDAGGCEEVNKYIEFCRGLRKSAFFVYDLDSLFIGTLRQCIRADGEIASFLAALGLGVDFGRYCGELDRKLTEAIAKIRESETCDANVLPLKSYLDGLVSEDGVIRDKNLQRARVALLIDIKSKRNEIRTLVSESLCADIEGRLTQIIELLRAKNVFLLPGGALEHYLPSYEGDRYKLDDSAKKAAVDKEVLELSSGAHDHDLQTRFGELFDVVEQLPAKPPVDTDAVLMGYLANYIHDLQGRVFENPAWSLEQINAYFEAQSSGVGKLFSLIEFSRDGERHFNGTIGISGGDKRVVKISHQTNAGMRAFKLEPAQQQALPSARTEAVAQA